MVVVTQVLAEIAATQAHAVAVIKAQAVAVVTKAQAAHSLLAAAVIKALAAAVAIKVRAVHSLQAVAGIKAQVAAAVLKALTAAMAVLLAAQRKNQSHPQLMRNHPVAQQVVTLVLPIKSG